PRRARAEAVRGRLTLTTPADRSWQGLGVANIRQEKVQCPSLLSSANTCCRFTSELIIDAPDIETACQEAVENDDWESAEEDGDGSGATTISAVREVPEVLIEQIESGNIHSGSFLWEDQPEYGPRLEIPAKFTNDE